MKYLIEYIVKSKGSFESENNLIYSDSQSSGTITLVEKELEQIDGYIFLSAFIIINEGSFESAAETSKSLLEEFVHAMKFTTNIDMQILRKVIIVEWEKGLETRYFRLFSEDCIDSQHYKVLNKELITSTELITNEKISTALRRAIRWYSQAISAQYFDEKFQCFWFAIEILAQHVKSAEKVSDSCSKCRKPLYCESCDEYPKHKPYPKQAIEFLFNKLISDKPKEAFDMCSRIRNRMMHGENIKEIENVEEIKFESIINNLGKVTWRAIKNVLCNETNNGCYHEDIKLLEVSSYCDYLAQAEICGSYKPTDPANPVFGEWPEAEIELIQK